MDGSLPPRRWLCRGVLALVVTALLLVAGVSAATDESVTLGPGTVKSPANGSTVVSVQGFHFRGIWNDNKPARLVAADARANTEWLYDGSKHDVRWFYDVDPLSNGNLLVTSTVSGDTVVYELDPRSGKQVWTERFDAKDTHDVDLVNGDQLLVANMRNTNESGISNDRIFIYDRSEERIVWQWKFRKHYPESTAGGYSDDWTHVNDVDKIGEGKFLVSPRNFDQVIVVDRSTGDITMHLGRDGNHDILFAQHNPDYLEGRNGTPTILIADSENDRVVEYRKNGSEWERTWTLSGGLNWPRDADRLPNGNTLITDTLNQRVIEVTPTGEVVWEYYAPWAPYDAERLSAAAPSTANATKVSIGGSNGPTIAEMNATGKYTLSGGTEGDPTHQEEFSSLVAAMASGTPMEDSVQFAADRYAHVVPFIRPVWLPSWGFAALGGAILIALPWLLAEVLYQRKRIRRGFARTFL